jgi:cell division protein FtsN
MAEKESNPKQWSDPKDFGLPFVEISPLAKSKSKAKETKDSVPTPVEELPKTPPVATVEKKKETKPSRPVEAPKPPVKNEKKKSKTWVWVVVFAFIGAVSVIVFQLKINQGPLEGDVEVPVTPPITALPQKPQVDSSALAAVDSLQVQDSTVSTISELPAVSTTSGTSIATESRISRVTQKEGKTRYFLVIGSFGTEEEADRFIQKTGNKFAEYQLIYPYEGSTNYRLAVGVFNSWNEASNKLNELKAQQSNGYWILKF